MKARLKENIILTEKERQARLSFVQKISKPLGSFAVSMVATNKPLYDRISNCITDMSAYYSKHAIEQNALLSSKHFYLLILDELKQTDDLQYRQCLFDLLLIFITDFELEKTADDKQKKTAQLAKKILLQLKEKQFLFEWMGTNKPSDEEFATLYALSDYFEDLIYPTQFALEINKQEEQKQIVFPDDLSAERLAEDYFKWLIDEENLPEFLNSSPKRNPADEKIAELIVQEEQKISKLNSDPFAIASTISITYPNRNGIREQLSEFKSKVTRNFNWISHTLKKISNENLPISVTDLQNLEKKISSIIQLNSNCYTKEHFAIIYQVELDLHLTEKLLRREFEKEKKHSQNVSTKSTLVNRFSHFVLLIQRIHDLRETLCNAAILYCDKLPQITGIGKVCANITHTILSQPANKKVIIKLRTDYYSLAVHVEPAIHVREKVDIVTRLLSRLTDYEVERKQSFNLLRRLNTTRENQINELIGACGNFIDNKNLAALLKKLHAIKKNIEAEYKVRSAKNSHLYSEVTWAIHNLESIENDELLEDSVQIPDKKTDGDNHAQQTGAEKKNKLQRTTSVAKVQQKALYKQKRNELALASFNNCFKNTTQNELILDSDLDRISLFSIDYLSKLNLNFEEKLKDIQPDQLLLLFNGRLMREYQRLFAHYKENPLALTQQKEFYQIIGKKLPELFSYLFKTYYIEALDRDQPIVSIAPTFTADWLTNPAQLQNAISRLTRIEFFEHAFTIAPDMKLQFEKLLADQSAEIILAETERLLTKDLLANREAIQNCLSYLQSPFFLCEFSGHKFPQLNHAGIHSKMVTIYMRYLELLDTVNDEQYIENAQALLAIKLTDVSEQTKQKHLIEMIQYRYTYLLFSKGIYSFNEINGKVKQYFQSNASNSPLIYFEAMRDFYQINPNLKKLHHPHLVINADHPQTMIQKANNLLNAYAQFAKLDYNHDLLNFLDAYINYLIFHQLDELKNLSQILTTNFSDKLSKDQFFNIIYKHISGKKNPALFNQILEKIVGFDAYLIQFPETLPPALANCVLKQSGDKTNLSVNKILRDISHQENQQASTNDLFDSYDSSLLEHYQQEKVELTAEQKKVWQSRFSESFAALKNNETSDEKSLNYLNLIAYGYCDLAEQQQYEKLIAANKKVTEIIAKIEDEHSDLYGSNSALINKKQLDEIVLHYNDCDTQHKKLLAEQLLAFFKKTMHKVNELNQDYACLKNKTAVSFTTLETTNDYAYLLTRLLDIYSQLQTNLPQNIVEQITNLLVSAKEFAQQQILPDLHPSSDFFHGSTEENHPNNLADEQPRELMGRFLLINSLFLNPVQVNQRLKLIYSAYIQQYANRTLAQIDNSKKEPFRFDVFEKFIPFAERYAACAGLGSALFSTNGRKNSNNFAKACQRNQADENYAIRLFMVYHGWLLEFEELLKKIITQMATALNSMPSGLLQSKYTLSPIDHSDSGYARTITELQTHFPKEEISSFCAILELARKCSTARSKLEKNLDDPTTDFEISLTSFYEFYSDCQKIGNFSFAENEAEKEFLFEKINKLNILKCLLDDAKAQAKRVSPNSASQLVKQFYILNLLNYSQNGLTVFEALNLAAEELESLLAREINFDPLFINKLQEFNTSEPKKFLDYLKIYIQQCDVSIPTVEQIKEIVGLLDHPEQLAKLKLVLPAAGLALNARTQEELKSLLQKAHSSYPWAEELLTQLSNLVNDAQTLKMQTNDIAYQNLLITDIKQFLEQGDQHFWVYNQDQAIEEKLKIQNFPEDFIDQFAKEMTDYFAQQKQIGKQLFTPEIVTQQQLDLSWKKQDLPEDLQNRIKLQGKLFSSVNVQKKAEAYQLIISFINLFKEKIKKDPSPFNKIANALEFKYFLQLQKSELEHDNVSSTVFFNLLNFTLKNWQEAFLSLPDSVNDSPGNKLLLLEKAITRLETVLQGAEFMFSEEDDQLSCLVSIESVFKNYLNTPWHEITKNHVNVFIAQIKYLQSIVPKNFFENIFKEFMNETTLNILAQLDRQLFFKLLKHLPAGHSQAAVTLLEKMYPFSVTEINQLQTVSLIHDTDLEKNINLCKFFNGQTKIADNFKKKLIDKFNAQIEKLIEPAGLPFIFNKLIQLDQLAKQINLPAKEMYKQTEKLICDWIGKHPNIAMIETICSLWPFGESLNRFPVIKAAMVEVVDRCRRFENLGSELFDNQLLSLKNKLKDKRLISLIDDIQTTTYFPPIQLMR